MQARVERDAAVPAQSAVEPVRVPEQDLLHMQEGEGRNFIL